MVDEELEKKVESHCARWETEKESYMLEPRQPHDGASPDRVGYTIVDIRTYHIVIIEDQEVAKVVVQRMLDAGVQVGNPFDPRVRKELIRRRNQAR